MKARALYRKQPQIARRNYGIAHYRAAAAYNCHEYSGYFAAGKLRTNNTGTLA